MGYNKNRLLLISFLLLMTLFNYQQRFTLRPDLYSILFFALYIYILSMHIDKRWSIPVILIVQVIWTNMHGFFFFGPLFILIGIVSEWIKRYVRLPYEWNDIGRLTNEEYARLKIIFVGVILACVVNPSFLHGAWYPIKVFFSLSGENKVFFNVIEELQKPLKEGTLWMMDQSTCFKLYIIFSF